MSVKVRVSYEKEPELLDVIGSLGKRVLKVEREPAKGRYKRAYLMLAEYPGGPEPMIKQAQ